ncbi:MAG TPA: hypothetical protein VEK75_05055 [Xanthobacteraceae bacterium]|nr:hypothetical protein [Xanthobacteraceae bacterium]
MTAPGGYKRMVIGLPQSIADQAVVDVAAELAEFLNIELLATFVADAHLQALAGFPAARELRILERGWQAIDLEQIARDLDRAASAARRRFAEAVRSRTIKTSFDVIAGADAMASLIRAGDIVAIIEPSHPGEQITRQFTGVVDAALAAASAVLVLPRRIARTAGPVMAVAAGPEDTSIHVALELAAALKEDLVVVTSAAVAPEIVARARALAVHLDEVTAHGPPTDVLATAPSPFAVKERLRVINRELLPDDAAQVFSMLHGVPLLVVEPQRIDLASDQEPGEIH